MIGKRRLQELIEQNDTIWDKNIFPIKLMNFEQKYDDCFYAHKAYIKNNQLICEVIGDYDFTNTYSFEDLFETKEDAEECAEFSNITRTERLELPSWEEFQTSRGFDFMSKNAEYCRVYKIEDVICVVKQNKIILDKPLTRENYNKARRICVKLFKGED